MPGWLQAFANVNPITVIIDALRALCLGGPTAAAGLEAPPGSAAAGRHRPGGRSPVPATTAS